jgi:hypothetical protein
MGIMRALGLIIAGFAGIALALSGSLFDKGQPSGWLYNLLGRQGSTAAVIIVCALIMLGGVVWIIRQVRELV